MITLAVNKSLSVEPSKKHMGSQAVTTLQVEWCRRQRTNFAFIKFDNPLDAVRLLLSRHPIYHFNHDKDSLPSRPSGKIFATKIPTNHTVEDIERAIMFILDQDPFSPGEPFEVQLGYEKGFITSPEKLSQLKRQLKMLAGNFVRQNGYKVELSTPENYHKTYRAYTEVRNVADTETLINGLQEETIGIHPLTVKPQLYSKVIILPKI